MSTPNWAPCFFLSPRSGCWNTNTKYCVTFNWLWINILHRLILCVLCCLHPHFCANLNTLTLGELPAKCRLFRCKTLDSETLQTGDCNSKQSHIVLQLYIYIYLNVYKYGHTTKVYPMSSLTAQRMICRCKGASFSSRTRLAHNKCLGVRPVFFSEQHEPGNVKVTQPGQGKNMKHVTLRNKHAGSTGSGIQSAQNGDVQQ